MTVYLNTLSRDLKFLDIRRIEHFARGASSYNSLARYWWIDSLAHPIHSLRSWGALGASSYSV